MAPPHFGRKAGRLAAWPTSVAWVGSRSVTALLATTLAVFGGFLVSVGYVHYRGGEA